MHPLLQKDSLMPLKKSRQTNKCKQEPTNGSDSLSTEGRSGKGGANHWQPQKSIFRAPSWPQAFGGKVPPFSTATSIDWPNEPAQLCALGHP